MEANPLSPIVGHRHKPMIVGSGGVLAMRMAQVRTDLGLKRERKAPAPTVSVRELRIKTLGREPDSRITVIVCFV